jgi:hypothetical protein
MGAILGMLGALGGGGKGLGQDQLAQYDASKVGPAPMPSQTGTVGPGGLAALLQQQKLPDGTDPLAGRR